MRTLLLSICIGMLLQATAARGGNPQAFEDANAAYANGEFAKAADAYTSVAESGRQSANLFYNLGNARVKLDQPGQAILNYKRALARNPAHPEAAADLSLLRERTGARIMEPSRLERLYPTVRRGWFAAGAAVGFWVFIFSVTAILLRTARRGALISAAVLAAMTMAYCAPAIWLTHKDRGLAVVVSKSTTARFAPVASATSAGTLPAGSEVRVIAPRGEWVYAEIPGDKRAWLPATDIIEVLSPQS